MRCGMRTGGTDGVLQRRDLLRGCLAGLAGFNAGAVHSAEVARAVDDPNIDAMAMLLPGLVDHAGNGPFVDLLRAVDEFCTEGRLRIRVPHVAGAVQAQRRQAQVRHAAPPSARSTSFSTAGGTAR